MSVIQTIITTNYRDPTHICVSRVPKMNVLSRGGARQRHPTDQRGCAGSDGPAPGKPRPGLRQRPEQMQSKQQIANIKINTSCFKLFFFK